MTAPDTTPAQTITCAMPGCGVTVPRADSVYIDNCGRVCRPCDPGPVWLEALLGDLEPPY
jgi:hypothetical protein